MIDAYEFGRMVVNGMIYTSDLIIFPDRIDASWWREAGHSLSVKDVQEIVSFKPELLILGTGYYGAMDMPASTIDYLQKQGIVLKAEKTKEACRLFNEVRSIKLVGAFHLTC